MQNTDKKVRVGIAIYAAIMIVIAFIAKGTGDEGDSILHYLYARSAWQHKIHFFDSWAKPVYVLMAFPFAQLGLVGIKLMNILLNCGSLWLIYRIAVHLKFRWAWIPSILLASTPMFNYLSLSGLTEPLSACFLLTGIYLLITEKWVTATLLFSFLPFVRSEGLLIMGVIFIYLVMRSKYQYIPLFLSGHIFYGMAGSYFYKDLLWVFNKMPYATWKSAYGSGEWMHFVQRLPETIGTAMSLFFFAGILYGLVMLIRYLRKQIVDHEKTELYLIYGSVIVYFMAHSAFWALGIFNSFGLLRVMVTIMPLIALISYRGIEYMIAFAENNQWQKRFVFAMTLLVFLYPFSNHVFAYQWKRDFQPKADQYAQRELAGWLQKSYPDYHSYTFYYEAVNLSEVLNIDWFNTEKRKRLLDAFVRNEFKSGDFIIWDDWFSVVEGHVTLEALEKDPRLEKLQTFQHVDYWGVTRTTILFRWK